MEVRGVGISRVGRSEGLGRGAEHFFELATEVGFAGELQLRRRSFVGATLRYQLPGKAALQIAQPSAGSATQVLSEQPL